MQEKIRRQSPKQKSMRVEEQKWNMGRDGGSGPGSGRGPVVCGRASDQDGAGRMGDQDREADGDGDPHERADGADDHHCGSEAKVEISRTVIVAVSGQPASTGTTSVVGT